MYLWDIMASPTDCGGNLEACNSIKLGVVLLDFAFVPSFDISAAVLSLSSPQLIIITSIDKSLVT